MHFFLSRQFAGGERDSEVRQSESGVGQESRNAKKKKKKKEKRKKKKPTGTCYVNQCNNHAMNGDC